MNEAADGEAVAGWRYKRQSRVENWSFCEMSDITRLKVHLCECTVTCKRDLSGRSLTPVTQLAERELHNRDGGVLLRQTAT